MALTKQLLGFGGVKMTYESTTFNLSTCHGDVIFTPIFIKKENIDYQLVYKFKGWRVEVEVDLYNIYTYDYGHFQLLMYMLNNACAVNGTIIILPRFTSGEATLEYDVYLNSKIVFEDIHQLEVGQTLKLKFIKPALIQELPIIVSGMTNPLGYSNYLIGTT